MIPFPKNKYDIIYADPPWSYKDKAHAGKRGAGYQYSTMSVLDLCRLPVHEIAENDCVLFLWVTMPMLPEAFKVIEHWGFKFRTCAFTWIKTNKKNHDTFFMGMGNWTRSNPELCLLATMGKPKRVDAGVHSIILSPLEAHSKKPNVVREKILKLMGYDKSRIELFAREKPIDWDVWGDQI